MISLYPGEQQQNTQTDTKIRLYTDETPQAAPIGNIKLYTSDIPSSLGGGSFIRSDNPDELIKSPRGYGNLSPEAGRERNHIVPVSLGGTSNANNVAYQNAGAASYRDNVEKYIAGEVRAGRMHLNAARTAVLNWEHTDIPGQPSYVKTLGHGDEGAGNIALNTLKGLPAASLNLIERFLPGVKAIRESIEQRSLEPEKKFLAESAKKLSTNEGIIGSALGFAGPDLELSKIVGEAVNEAMARGASRAEIESIIKSKGVIPPPKTESTLKDALGRPVELPQNAKFYSQENAEKILGKVKKEAGFVNPGTILEDAKKALEDFKAGQENKSFGENLRAYFVGERNARQVATNQLREKIARIIPSPIEQEAMTLYRDFKGRPDELRQFLDGTHPYYQDAFHTAESRTAAVERVQKLTPVINQALHPTPGMLEADKAFTAYAKGTLAEGRQLGILDSSIADEDYITHLLQPKDQVDETRAFLGNKGQISRSLPFSKTRTYDTVLHAAASDVNIRSLNAIDALTIHGQKYSTAAATKLLTNALKEADMGLYGVRGAENIPKDWVPAAPGQELFKNRIPFVGEGGKAGIANQQLMVPKKVADALRPLVEPSFVNRIPFVGRLRNWNAYIKTMNVSFGLFHSLSLTTQSVYNQGIIDTAKAISGALEDEAFLEAERGGSGFGLQTPILGRSLDALQAVKKATALPERMDFVRALPGVSELEKGAEAMTQFTFDKLGRKIVVSDFSFKRAAWLAKHPTATEPETLLAMRSIAKEVNATYGFPNKDILGISKTAQDVSRALLFAPDWLYGQYLQGKAAFSGGPAGIAARTYWARVAIYGTIASELTSLLFSGKTSPDPSMVYMGKDDKGKNVLVNMFFRGAPGTLVNLITHIKDQGSQGIFQTIGNKVSPLLKVFTTLLTGRNYQGQNITTPGLSPAANTIRSIGAAAQSAAPVPFILSNIWNLAFSKDHYTLPEYIISTLGGVPTRHVIPAGQEQIKSGKKAGKLRQIPDRGPKQRLIQQIKTGKPYAPRTKTKKIF